MRLTFAAGCHRIRAVQGSPHPPVPLTCQAFDTTYVVGMYAWSFSKQHTPTDSPRRRRHSLTLSPSLFFLPRPKKENEHRSNPPSLRNRAEWVSSSHTGPQSGKSQRVIAQPSSAEEVTAPVHRHSPCPYLVTPLSLFPFPPHPPRTTRLVPTRCGHSPLPPPCLPF